MACRSTPAYSLWTQPATSSVPVSLPTTSFNGNCVNSCHKRHLVLHWQRQCLRSDLIRLERCLRHGGPWVFAEHYIQQVWTERSSSPVASVIPVRPHSGCQHQQSTVYAEYSVVRCATRFRPWVGTIRPVYGGPWRVNHRLQCSTSLLSWWQSTTGFHNSRWRRRCLSQFGAMCICCSRLVYPSPPTAEPQQDWGDVFWV